MKFLQKEELMMLKYLETVVAPQHSRQDHHIESHSDHDDGRQRERESPHRNSLTESKKQHLISLDITTAYRIFLIFFFPIFL